jgi:hypothetical protein
LLAYVGNCYIRTLKEDGTYGTYSALMLQPQKRSPKVKSQMDYVIEFRWLVAV